MRPFALRRILIALVAGMLGLGACAQGIYGLPGIEDPYRILEMFLAGDTFSVQNWLVCVLWLVCASLAALRSLPWAALLALLSLNEFVEFRDLAPPSVLAAVFWAAVLAVPGALALAVRRPALWRESLVAALYATGVCASGVPTETWIRFAGEAGELAGACLLIYALADALAARASRMRNSPA